MRIIKLKTAMQHNRRYIDSMRIIVLLFGLLSLTACSSHQKSHHSLFVKSVYIMADSMRENIYEFQKLSEETEFNARALAVVRGQALEKLPAEYSADAMDSQLELVQRVQDVAYVLAPDVPLSKDKLTHHAQIIYEYYEQETTESNKREAHAVLQKLIQIMVVDWHEDSPMETLPKSIVANVNKSEECLLLELTDPCFNSELQPPLKTSGPDKNFILKLEHATLQHLQKKQQRKELLTNWQNLKPLTKKMLIAHEALLEKREAPIKDFYEAALKLQEANLKLQNK